MKKKNGTKNKKKDGLFSTLCRLLHSGHLRIIKLAKIWKLNYWSNE